MRSALIALGVVAIAIAVYALWPQQDPMVEILLRCDDGIDGTLDIAPTDAPPARLSAEDACRSGSFSVVDAGQGQQIRLDYRGPQIQGQLVLRDGIEITRGNDGAYAVIELRPPHLRLGRI